MKAQAFSSLGEMLAAIMEPQQYASMESADKLAVAAMAEQPDTIRAMANLLGAVAIIGLSSRQPNATPESILNMVDQLTTSAWEDIVNALHRTFHDNEVPEEVRANPLRGTRVASLIIGMAEPGENSISPLDHEMLVSFAKGPLRARSEADEKKAEAIIKAQEAAEAEVKH